MELASSDLEPPGGSLSARCRLRENRFVGAGGVRLFTRSVAVY